MTDSPGDKITRRQTLAVMIAASMVPAMARTANAASPDFAAFNARFAAKFVLPAFDVLAKETDAFAETADAFCAAPDTAGLDRVKQGFNDVSDAWAGAQQFRLGALAQGQRSERFSYWPERRNIVEKQLSALLAGNDKAELAADRFATASVAIQGLPALERIIYGGDHGQDFLQGENAMRHCAVVVAIAHNLKAISAETKSAWEATLEDPAKAASPFTAEAAEAVAQSYTNLLTIMQIVVDQKIGAPLGADAESARPKSAEQWRSGRSLRNIARNLITARQSVLGPGGFADLLGAGQAALKDGLAKAFDDAIDAAKAAGDDLSVAILRQDKRMPVTSLLVKVNHLRDLLRQQVPPAMGITLGFNELDGDGS